MDLRKPSGAAYVFPQEQRAPVYVTFPWFYHVFDLDCGTCGQRVVKGAWFSRVRCRYCEAVNIVRWCRSGF